MNHALDACALIAYLRGEPGAEVVDELLQADGETCFAHAINLCEVYYDFLRSADVTTAEQALSDLTTAGVIERADLDPAFWRSAGHIKAGGRVSLADSFCLALAQRLDADVVTSDHREFDAIVTQGVCAVRFIR